MKKYFSLLLFIFNQFNLISQEIDKSFYAVKGEVKFLEQVKYIPLIKDDGQVVKGGKIGSGDFESYSKIIFNKKGHVQEWYGYLNDDSEFKDTTKYFYKYNSANQLTEWMIYTNANISKKFIYKLDSLGNTTSKFNIDSEGNINTQTQYKYDGLGNRVEEILQHPNFNTIEKIVSQFDSKNQIIKKEWINYLNEKTRSCSFDYDINGKVVEEKYFDIDNNIYQKNTYKYNSKGMVIEEIIIFPNDSSRNKKMIFSWSPDGLLTEKSTFDIDLFTLIRKSVYKYDDKGNCIEEELDSKVYYSNEIKRHKIQTQFVYDDKNNWIKKIIFIDNQPINYFERIIEYY